jgi:hypothetical protein
MKFAPRHVPLKAQTGGNTMHWITKCARTLQFLIPVLAFATPTFAQV